MPVKKYKKPDPAFVKKGDTLFVMSGEQHMDNIVKKYKDTVKKIIVYGAVVRFKGGTKGNKARYPYDISVSRGKFLLDERK